MTYPSAPWMLKGYAFHTLQLANVDRVSPFLPANLHLVSILPGKTLCCVYLASYEQGSTLQYHELIVAFLVRYRYRICSWISNIYVDDEDSMAGGREIWGLSKELAHFNWQVEEQRYVSVEKEDEVLCRLHFNQPRWLWQQPFIAPVISFLNSDILSFTGRIRGLVGTAPGDLITPAHSPLAAFDLKQSVQTYHHRDMHFIAEAPRAIAHLQPYDVVAKPAHTAK